MSQFEIKLKTGNKFWTPQGLGAMGMDSDSAIAELVANSLDWRRSDDDGISSRIEIKVGRDILEIIDNGVGMTVEDLRNAVQVSVASDQLRRRLRARKGMFGMGMKVACLSLGWDIKIRTRPLESKGQENYFHLESRKLMGNEQAYRDSLVGESGKCDENGPLGGYESGTAITITDLTNKKIEALILMESLSDIFSPELGGENIELITIDCDEGENAVEYRCRKKPVALIEGTEIILDDQDLRIMERETGQEYKIRGHLGLLQVSSSGSGNWGLHLYKNNQVIERFHQAPARKPYFGLMPYENPHPTFGRVYGEIHLDMCRPAFNKVGFDYYTEEWAEARELLKPFLKNACEASKQFRKGSPTSATQAGETMKRATRKAEELTQKIVGEGSKETEGLPENAIPIRDGRYIILVPPIIRSLPEFQKNKPWTFFFRDKSSELEIFINQDSAIYQKIERENNTAVKDAQLEMLSLMATLESVVQLLTGKFDMSYNDAYTFRDEKILSRIF